MRTAVLTEAFILHRRPYRETSFILEVFTKEHGRLSLIAKGIRRKNNNLAGVLQAFVPLYLSFRGKGELLALTNAELKQSPYFLTGNQLVVALYLNELLMNLVPKDDAYPELFMHYESMLEGLQARAPDEKMIRLFEMQLLQGLGYGLFSSTPKNSHDESFTHSNIFDEDSFYQFILGQGFVKVALGRSQGGAEFLGMTLNAIANGEYQKDAWLLKECKRLLRFVLNELMNAKPIVSRELFVRLLESEYE